MFLPRLYGDLANWIEGTRLYCLSGPCFIGKTTLIKNFLKKYPYRYKLDSGENKEIQEVFFSLDPDKFFNYSQGYKLIVIEEANYLQNLADGLKIFQEQIPGIQILISTSSCIDIRSCYQLFPVSQMELTKIFYPGEMQDRLSDWLLYGGYPAVISENSKPKKIRLLGEIVSSYLLKDILALERVKDSETLLALLRLVALHVGEEVSYYELGSQLGIDYKTVARYLEIFEKYFILVPLYGYNSYAKTEILKKKKYYFYDNGILNSLIGNFGDLNQREDVSILWENFLFMERFKLYSTEAIFLNQHYWKTWGKHEIDLVEEWGRKIHGYEFKWKAGKSKQEKQWLLANPDASFEVINRENYYSFCIHLGYDIKPPDVGLDLKDTQQDKHSQSLSNGFPHNPPNDPFYKHLWNLHDDGHVYGSGKGKIVSKYGIQAMKAWKEGFSGKGVIVALLNSGVAYENYYDPITDRHYKKAPDFEKTNFLSSLARDFTIDPPGLHANDWWGLGTQDCHIIAATINNKFGGCGIAYKAEILPIKIASRFEQKTKTMLEAYSKAIKYAADCGAKVIVCTISFGKKDSTARLKFKPGGQKAMHEAVKYAYQKGSLIVCSSSYTSHYGVREGTVVYPGGFPECLAVGYTRFDGNLTSYSNFGDYISIFAPSSDSSANSIMNKKFAGIYVETFIPWDTKGNYSFNQRFHYQFMGNPNNAVAEVAAVAALVFEKHPDWAPDQVKTAITKSAKSFVTLRNDKLIQYGILDAYGAVSYTP